LGSFCLAATPYLKPGAMQYSMGQVALVWVGLLCCVLLAVYMAMSHSFDFGDMNHPSITPLSWDEAYAKAKRTVSQMTRVEKNSMLHSTMNEFPGWFIGNIPGVPRVGIPSLNMQDNGNGFRTSSEYYIGTVTCWPSGLSLAATWDEQLVHKVALAIGSEFRIKGANVILGPAVFVHRIARGGRNFESLSGEDPHLGSKLAVQWITGMQSRGIVATVKHFVFNQQETNRNSYNAEVDDKTAWELYYQPFQAAVDAGVGAAMCSYNLQDGKHSCSNPRRLKGDLKGTMGFRGFVMSDWGGEHATSIEDGEDMDMVNGAYNDQFNANSVSQDAVNDALTRTVATIYKMQLEKTTKCSGGSCFGPLHADAQQGHHDIARRAATESIVLLKNEGGILPLKASRVKKIRVLGKAAHAGVVNPIHAAWTVADLYSGGGSGHVTPGYHVSAFDGIRSRASQSGIQVLDDSSEEQADLTIVVAGTTSAETLDRKDLSLDDGADDLIASLGTNTNVVVLLQIPGAVLMPWKDSVQAIAAMFLGGQETGNAWASVLFGDHAPTGHLPVSIPATEADTIQPSSGTTITYSEGLATGYRNKHFTYAFPFGHGLTYTNFSYNNVSNQPCGQSVCVHFQVTNIGDVAAATIPQLYLEYPAEAKQPAALLRGFTKTPILQSGQMLPVMFQLGRRDFSYWDSGFWHQVSAATVHIGASSADIRLSFPVNSFPFENVLFL